MEKPPTGVDGVMKCTLIHKRKNDRCKYIGFITRLTAHLKMQFNVRFLYVEVIIILK